MTRYQAGINSINEGPSHSFKGYCRKWGIEGIKKITMNNNKTEAENTVTKQSTISVKQQF